MKIEELKKISNIFETISSNKNSPDGYIVDSNYFFNQLDELKANYGDYLFFDKNDQNSFLLKLKEIQFSISNNRIFNTSYIFDPKFVHSISLFANNTKHQMLMEDEFIDVIDKTFKNINEMAQKHGINIDFLIKELNNSILNYKNNKEIKEERDRTLNIVDELEKLHNGLSPQMLFGVGSKDAYFTESKQSELLTSPYLLYLTMSQTNEQFTKKIITKLNEIGQNFETVYKMIASHVSNNIAKQYLENEQDNNSVRKMLVNKDIDSKIDCTISNMITGKQIFFFYDGSIVSKDKDNSYEIKDFNLLKNEIKSFTKDYLKGNIPEFKELFETFLKEDLSNIYDVLYSATVYSENSYLFNNNELQSLTKDDFYDFMKAKFNEETIKIYMNDVLSKDNILHANDYTIEILKNMYNLNSEDLRKNVKQLPNFESTMELNTYLVQSLNMFNGFNKNEYLIRASKVKANVIKTNENKLLIELRNQHQVNEFIDRNYTFDNIKYHSFVNNIGTNLVYPYIVLDFDKCPSESNSEMVLELDLHKKLNSFKFKCDPKYTLIKNNEYNDLINLIVKKNPKIKSKI